MLLKGTIMIFDRVINKKDFLDNELHIGHSRAYTNAFMQKNIIKIRKSISLIDIEKSLSSLEKACSFVYNHNLEYSFSNILFILLRHRTADALLSLKQIQQIPNLHYFLK